MPSYRAECHAIVQNIADACPASSPNRGRKNRTRLQSVHKHNQHSIMHRRCTTTDKCEHHEFTQDIMKPAVFSNSIHRHSFSSLPAREIRATALAANSICAQEPLPVKQGESLAQALTSSLGAAQRDSTLLKSLCWRRASRRPTANGSALNPTLMLIALDYSERKGQ